MPRIGARGRRRSFLIAIMIVAAVGAGLYWAWPHLFPSPIAEGLAAYGRGDWKAADAQARARLKKAPNDREALRLLARTAARQRQDSSARNLYARLGGAEAMQAEDFYLFGSLLDRSGNKETARECWEAGLHADPNHAELLDEFAHLFLRGDKLTPAAKFAQRLVKQPGWEARGDLILGRIYYQNDDPAAAIECLRRGLDRAPQPKRDLDSPVDYRKLLIRALLREGQATEATSRLKTVLASGPDPEASWLLSRSYLQAGSAAEASAALEQGGSYRDRNPVQPEPARYVGAARCAECHREIYQTQQHGLHSRTFQRSPEIKDLPLTGHPVPDPAQSSVSHTIERNGGETQYVTKDHDRSERAIVDFVFGSGHRGATLVGHDEKGRVRELRLSYYSDGPTWDLTTGHPSVPPATEGYLGRFLSADDLRSCFQCHTTVPRSARERKGPESADRGIGCEQCHGPGENHLKAVTMQFPDLAIALPRPGEGAEGVALCARCHSPMGREVTRLDPVAVRFPGTTLTWSRCYTESGGKFDCRTCHNPHRDSETSPAYYEAKCLSCHATTVTSQRRSEKAETGAGRVGTAHLFAGQDGGPCPPYTDATPATGQTEAPRRSVCPVNPSKGCISCHMPATKIAIPHSTFTDHHIRVHPRAVAGGNSDARTEPPK